MSTSCGYTLPRMPEMARTRTQYLIVVADYHLWKKTSWGVNISTTVWSATFIDYPSIRLVSYLFEAGYIETASIANIREMEIYQMVFIRIDFERNNRRS